MSSLAFWVAQQVLDGRTDIPKDLLVPYLAYTQDDFEAGLEKIPAGSVATKEYTQAEAIEAIKAAGKVPGKDIKIITVDAVKDGMTALAAGEINYIVECSPLLGEQLMDLTKKVLKGEEVPARVVTEETTFTPEQAKAALPTRKY